MMCVNSASIGGVKRGLEIAFSSVLHVSSKQLCIALDKNNRLLRLDQDFQISRLEISDSVIARSEALEASFEFLKQCDEISIL